MPDDGIPPNPLHGGYVRRNRRDRPRLRADPVGQHYYLLATSTKSYQTDKSDLYTLGASEFATPE